LPRWPPLAGRHDGTTKNTTTTPRRPEEHERHRQDGRCDQGRRDPTGEGDPAEPEV